MTDLEVRTSQRRLTSLLVACAGLLLTATVAWRVDRFNQRFAESAFAEATQNVTDRVIRRIRLYEYGLRGARGAIVAAGPDNIDSEVFRTYSESADIDRDYPGARGFGFIRKVPADRLDRYLNQKRRDIPGFALRTLADPQHDAHYIIELIEPIARNQPSRGLDIASERQRRQAAQRAMRTGEAVLTGPITLVQASSMSNRSLLFLLPVYQQGMDLSDAQARERACYGWAFAPLALEEVTQDFDLSHSDMQLTLTDVTEGARPAALFSSPALKDAAHLSSVHRINVYGRTWVLQLQAEQRFLARLQPVSPWLVTSAGALLSLLSATLHAVWSRARQRDRAAVDQNAKLATIVTQSADAIIGQALDGTVLNWNPAATALFDWSEGHMLGRQLAAFILPPERAGEEAVLRKRVRDGDAIAPFDTTWLTAAGELIDVSVTAGAIRAHDGRIVGIATLVRDIRDRKAAERQMQLFNATLERVDATFMMVASIQEKNWNQRILTPERLQQFTARHAFQGGVDDQEIEHLQRCQFQRLNAAFGKVDGESGLAQTEAVVVASLEVVFDDQYLRLHTCHACELCR